MDKANQPSKPVRIFIVEDEHRIARFLQIELEHEGFETETEEVSVYERPTVLSVFDLFSV